MVGASLGRPSWRAFAVSGWSATKAITFSWSGWPVSGSGVRALVKARKSSASRTMNTGSGTEAMSVASPSGRWNLTAIPRPAIGLASEVFGLPLALEKRTVVFTGSPWKWAARESSARLGGSGEGALTDGPLRVDRAEAGMGAVDRVEGVHDLLVDARRLLLRRGHDSQTIPHQAPDRLQIRPRIQAPAAAVGSWRRCRARSNAIALSVRRPSAELAGSRRTKIEAPESRPRRRSWRRPRSRRSGGPGRRCHRRSARESHRR